MTIDEILDLWKHDCRMNEHDLDHESLRIPELQNKYLKPLLDARIELKRSIKAKKKLYGLLKQYYRGELNNPTDLAKVNRTAWPLRVIKENIDDYIDQDSEYLALCDTVDYNEERVAALEEILHMLKNRGFQINAALKFLEIKSGF